MSSTLISEAYAAMQAWRSGSSGNAPMVLNHNCWRGSRFTRSRDGAST